MFRTGDLGDITVWQGPELGLRAAQRQQRAHEAGRLLGQPALEDTIQKFLAWVTWPDSAGA